MRIKENKFAVFGVIGFISVFLISFPLIAQAWEYGSMGVTDCPTYRYKMTVEVDTPSGLKSGSSIIEVKNWTQKGLAAGVNSKVRGEAVSVEIAPDRYLFALLGSPDYPDYADGIAIDTLLEELPEDDGSPERWCKVIEKLITVKVAQDIPSDILPLFVSFRDLATPETVFEVRPRDMGEIFGEDVKLRGVYIELASDFSNNSSKKNLERIIPWINSLRGRLVPTGNPKTDYNNTTSRLSVRHFRQ